MKIEKYKAFKNTNKYCGISFNFKNTELSLWADLYNWVLIPTITFRIDYLPYLIEDGIKEHKTISVCFNALCFDIRISLTSNKKI